MVGVGAWERRVTIIRPFPRAVLALLQRLRSLLYRLLEQARRSQRAQALQLLLVVRVYDRHRMPNRYLLNLAKARRARAAVVSHRIAVSASALNRLSCRHHVYHLFYHRIHT